MELFLCFGSSSCGTTKVQLSKKDTRQVALQMFLWVFCDLMDNLLMCACSSFGWRAASGKVYYFLVFFFSFLVFFPFVDHDSHYDSLEFQSIRIIPVTLSRLTDDNDNVFT